jgi:hypothetical protein
MLSIKNFCFELVISFELIYTYNDPFSIRTSIMPSPGNLRFEVSHVLELIYN